MATVTMAIQQNRNAGIFTTPSWHVPEGLTGTISLATNILLSDLQDVRNSLSYLMFVSDDNVTWREYAGFSWEGGNYLDKFGQITKGPNCVVNLAEIVGKYVRVQLTIGRRMAIGLDLDY